VNREMEHYFRELLKNNKSLESKDISAEEQIQHNLLPGFESTQKRVYDMSIGLDGLEHFIIHGLDEDESKGFGKNRVKVQRYYVLLTPITLFHLTYGVLF
jgi:hypothetical protein